MPNPKYAQETLAEIYRIAMKCIERFGPDINMEHIARLAYSAMNTETEPSERQAMLSALDQVYAREKGKTPRKDSNQ